MKKIILLFFAATLSACGFHLKSKQDLAHLSAIQLSVADELHDTVIKSLQKQNISIDKNAAIHLIVEDFTSKRRQSAIGNTGGTREIEINYLFNVRIQRDNKTIASQNMKQSAYLHYESEQYLGGNAEENEVKESLTEKSAQQILHFLAAITKSQ